MSVTRATLKGTPLLRCSPALAEIFGTRPRKVGDGIPAGFMLVVGTDGAFWLTPIDPDAWREK